MLDKGPKEPKLIIVLGVFKFDAILSCLSCKTKWELGVRSPPKQDKRTQSHIRDGRCFCSCCVVVFVVGSVLVSDIVVFVCVDFVVLILYSYCLLFFSLLFLIILLIIILLNYINHLFVHVRPMCHVLSVVLL